VAFLIVITVAFAVLAYHGHQIHDRKIRNLGIYVTVACLLVWVMGLAVWLMMNRPPYS
jgi:dolichyl-phosphate-mannose--protein O-mannosyl transferase